MSDPLQSHDKNGVDVKILTAKDIPGADLDLSKLSIYNVASLKF